MTFFFFFLLISKDTQTGLTQSQTHTVFFLNRGIITDYRILVTCGAEYRLYISSLWGMTRGLLWTPKLLHEIVTNNRISQAGRRFIWRFGQNKMGRFSETTNETWPNRFVWFSDCFRHAFFQHPRVPGWTTCTAAVGVWVKASMHDNVSVGSPGLNLFQGAWANYTKFMGFPFKLIKLARVDARSWNIL